MAKTAIANASRLNAFSLNPDDIVIVGLDTEDGPDHPLYDERIKFSVDEAMVLNIMSVGVLQPIIVRKDGDRVQVVAGRQRVRAAREANKRLRVQGLQPLTIPAMTPIKGDNAHMLGVLISENEIRRDDSHRVKAEKVRRLLAYGWDEERIAVAFGQTKIVISRYAAWWDLDKSVQTAVDKGTLSFTAATDLAKKPRAEQVEKLGKLETIADAKGKPATVRQTRDLIREDAGKTPLPTAGLIRRVLKTTAASDLDPAVVATLKWITGDLDPARVRGLTACLHEVEEAKEAKAKRKADAQPAGPQEPETAMEKALKASINQVKERRANT